MEYINDVKLCGKVTRELEYSHEFNGVPFYSTDVEVIQVKKNKKSVAVVRCYLSGNQILVDNPDITAGKIINIEGKFINSKIKGLTDISLLIDKYSVLEKLEDGYDTSVVISGEVTKIFTNPDNYKGFVNFVVAQFDADHKKTFSTRVVIWNRLADHVFKNLAVGDHVQVKGGVNNSKTQSKVDGEEPETVLVSEVLGFYFTKL
jgi:primosomal replication protein N